jgi:hypothetical protein
MVASLVSLHQLQRGAVRHALRRSSLIVLGVVLGSDRARAQAAPFLFSMTPASPRQITGFGYYEVAYASGRSSQWLATDWSRRSEFAW